MIALYPRGYGAVFSSETYLLDDKTCTLLGCLCSKGYLFHQKVCSIEKKCVPLHPL